GPLWSVPLSNTSARTGMSDSMSPGDFNQLMSSNEIAFRATFSGEVPKVSQLYWRGLVFSHFDGRRWSQSHSQLTHSNLRWTPQTAQDWLGKVDFSGPELRYEIIMEPSFQPWLFALSAPRRWDQNIAIGPDLRL